MILKWIWKNNFMGLAENMLKKKSNKWGLALSDF